MVAVVGRGALRSCGPSEPGPLPWCRLFHAPGVAFGLSAPSGPPGHLPLRCPVARFCDAKLFRRSRGGGSWVSPPGGGVREPSGFLGEGGAQVLVSLGAWGRLLGGLVPRSKGRVWSERPLRPSGPPPPPGEDPRETPVITHDGPRQVYRPTGVALARDRTRCPIGRFCDGKLLRRSRGGGRCGSPPGGGSTGTLRVPWGGARSGLGVPWSSGPFARRLGATLQGSRLV